jgi:hypothetical protein
MVISESERRIRILDYVRENSMGPDQKEVRKITKSDVMRHLKDVRPMTTHKTVVELIKEGKIKMVKDKPYSQTDYLVINENNEFNQIHNMLREFETFMNLMDKPVSKIKMALDKKPHDDHELAAQFGIVASILEPFRESFDLIFQNILIRIIRSSFSQEERLMLTMRISTLIDKLADTYSKKYDLNTYLKKHIPMYRDRISKDKDIQDYAKKHKIDLNMMDELILILEKFTRFNT